MAQSGNNDNEQKVQGDGATQEKSKQSIEEILRERKKLDKTLQAEYSREVTLLFTDIVGSTSFFERRGDIEGRSMIQEHNDILFPIVKTHEGKVLKTVGDAIMASFSSPEEAVRSAIEIQRTLFERNKKEAKDDQIRVRIGLNFGQGIVQEDDIFGDVVNVAARVESLAEAEQVLISKSIYDKVRRTEDILCRYHDSTQVKGKAEPLEVYRVVWGEEEATVDRTRSAKYAAAPAAVKKPSKIFELDLTRENSTIKVSGYEKSPDEKRTVVHYEDAQISSQEIDKFSREVNRLLNQANTEGKVSKEILVKLEKVGQSLFDGLLTPMVKDQILKTEAEDLILNIDDHLVHIPWELLFDGKQFFCQRFNMGRLVKTRQAVEGIKTRKVEPPLKMLILSDPRKDLPASHQEGLSLTAEADKEEGLVTAIHRFGNVKVEDVRKSLRNYDVVHYAGHADYDTTDPSKSGWLLSEGKFTSQEIKKATGASPMPALVFSNACHSGQTEEWKIDEKIGEKIYGLANAFLLYGVQHYIGTFWEIQDEPGSYFAMELYRHLFRGNTIGEAMRLARESLVKKYGEETIVWASYMLYGDPTYRYFEVAEKSPRAKLEVVKGREEAAALGVEAKKPSFKTVVGAGIAALVVLALVIGAYFFLSPRGRLAEDPVEKAFVKLKAGQLADAEQDFIALSKASGSKAVRGYEGMAGVWFEKGDYTRAEELCEKVLGSDPQNIYAQVVKGNISFAQGNMDEAIKAYEAATRAAHGSTWQKAEAFNRLGRIYAEQNKGDAALASFNQAITLYPADSEALSNRAVLLASMGKTDEAISSYQQALKKNPQDSLTTLLLNQLLSEKKAVADKDRQERMDKLVAELSAQFKQQKAEGKPSPLSDTWTSRPLTLTFLNFENKGAIPVRGGENEFVMYRLTQALQGKDRITVVERELVDKLLEELKLSSSELADPATALRLGSIVGARFITSGNVLRMGNEMQVSLRVIETETSKLTGSFIEKGGESSNLGTVADSLADQIVKKITDEFPLRGSVAQVDGENVIITIGAREGVKVGLKMNVFQDGEHLTMEGRDLGRKKNDVGDIEIISVEEKMSTGRLVRKAGEFKKGQRVIEIVGEKAGTQPAGAA